MPPKTRFTKEQVVRAAFAIIDKRGLKALSAREVARKLKSSTAPVYSYFKTMEKLKRAVAKKGKNLMIEYAVKPYTDIVFLNMGVGFASFARDHKQLFRAFFLESGEFKDVVNKYLEYLQNELVKDKRFESMPSENRGELLRKMWIFTHGLATLMCVGIIKDDSEEYIIKTLKDVGRAVIGQTLTDLQEKSTNKEQD